METIHFTILYIYQVSEHYSLINRLLLTCYHCNYHEHIIIRSLDSNKQFIFTMSYATIV